MTTLSIPPSQRLNALRRYRKVMGSYLAYWHNLNRKERTKRYIERTALIGQRDLCPYAYVNGQFMMGACNLGA